MSSTLNTPAELFEHLKFITGQDNLSAVNGTRLFKYALNDYSMIAMDSDGVQKFDDRNHVDASGNPTYPISTSTVSAANPKIALDKSFLQLDRVTVTLSNGTERPLHAIDRRDYKDTTLEVQFGTGVPTHYDIDGNGLAVYPVPNGTYTTTVYYTRAAKIIDVTDNTTDVGIPLTHHFYLILHCARQLGYRTIDANRTDVAGELIKWEGAESGGRISGGKIRHYYATRDEDRPKRMRVKNLSTRTFNRINT